MSSSDRFTLRLASGLFFISGFSALTYQIVWTRLAFASFGIISPVLSVVLSVFMLGLAIGSWLGGRVISPLARHFGVSAAAPYAAAELLIALGAALVPALFALGSRLLLTVGPANSWAYLGLSAIVLTAALLPWCVCMGATFPFMMACIRERLDDGPESFSLLYVANVLGAITGTIVTALVLIELLGFERTLWVAAAGNLAAAASSGWLGWRPRAVLHQAVAAAPDPRGRRAAAEKPSSRRSKGRSTWAAPQATGRSMAQWTLFTTGFGAMACEVVWTRDFTPVLKTQVYSFALVVVTYLAATCAGSIWYRRHIRAGSVWSPPSLVGFLMVTAFIPIVGNDPRLVHSDWAYTIDAASALTVLASICPMCLVLGYLTPMLIDEYSSGDPAVAGRAYAINVLGCILGPLFASYVLLPWMTGRHALVLLGLPFFVQFAVMSRSRVRHRSAWLAAGAAMLAVSLLATDDFENLVRTHASRTATRRDYAASVLAADFGSDRGKVLLVNGIGMTTLSPVTKVMVHLPLALHRNRPESALIICFGMGTTFRSAMSWGINTTAVELVPGVTQAFGFYYPKDTGLFENPNARVVVDDGRRYLMRTRDLYDVIVVDPPPPPEAAGSSLLFSEEFSRLARAHLKPNGILQTWYIGQEFVVYQALLRGVSNVFPYVRTFGSIEGWGIHVLASASPIDPASPDALAARMPPAAQRDLTEWAPSETASSFLKSVLAREVSVESSLNGNTGICIKDDRPMNEYFLLRRAGLLHY